jgi:thiamine pyrophosphate-dependent acetolactate synthase large subunit-like protein
MERLEATRVVAELAGDAPIIGGVGNSTFDLVPFDRPRNFYMWNSMGMASSIGLGLALARRDLRVIVLDGDGSILLNLSSLATEISSGVTNLVHVIWDNGGWEITGGQPAGSPFGVNLEVMARGCGFLKTATVDDLAAFSDVFAEAMTDDQSWVIVGKVEPGDSPYRPSKNCISLRDRFMTALPSDSSSTRASARA